MAGSNNRLTPRQKMINLMYIVLTAMLALNVSSDVLDGFVQVHDGLNRSNSTVSRRNEVIYSQLEAFAQQNPEKGQAWYDKASEVRLTTRALYDYVDSLKRAIVYEADGKKGDPENIVNRDDLEAASVVMLNPHTLVGEQLRHEIDGYRDYIIDLMPDSTKRLSIAQALSTSPIQLKGQISPQLWEEAQFDQKPVVAAVTLLTKLQNDILYAEGEALGTLYSQIDAGDVRVNEINAFVIPQSRIVMRGGDYTANIVLAAVDTTQRPEIFIGDKLLENSNGVYRLTTGATGTFDYTGYLQVQHGDGTVTRHDFSSQYTVIEPMATVSATMMNVLYAGINNPISISVPGVPMSEISATMTNGTLTRSGDGWIARPTGVGKDAVLTVTANIEGRQTQVANSTFRVRQLPDPTPYVEIANQDGNIERYKGGKPVLKSQMLKTDQLLAAIDDGLLDTQFEVESFELVFIDSQGDASKLLSDGPRFSSRQKQRMQQIQGGKRFYISNIKAKGPDGTTRTLSPMEVQIR